MRRAFLAGIDYVDPYAAELRRAGRFAETLGLAASAETMKSWERDIRHEVAHRPREP